MKTEAAETQAPSRIIWKAEKCMVKAVMAGRSTMMSSGLMAITLP